MPRAYPARMRWEEFEVDAPSLARLGRERLGEPGVVLVATLRADGLPRVSPVEPLFWNSELWLSMLWGSRKALDLQRDARVLVHSIVLDPQATGGEYKVRGARPKKPIRRCSGLTPTKCTACSGGIRSPAASIFSASTSKTSRSFGGTARRTRSSFPGGRHDKSSSGAGPRPQVSAIRSHSRNSSRGVCGARISSSTHAPYTATPVRLVNRAEATVRPAARRRRCAVREPEHERPVEPGRRVRQTKPEDLVREATRERHRHLGVCNVNAAFLGQHLEELRRHRRVGHRCNVRQLSSRETYGDADPPRTA